MGFSGFFWILGGYRDFVKIAKKSGKIGKKSRKIGVFLKKSGKMGFFWVSTCSSTGFWVKKGVPRVQKIGKNRVFSGFFGIFLGFFGFFRVLYKNGLIREKWRFCNLFVHPQHFSLIFLPTFLIFATRARRGKGYPNIFKNLVFLLAVVVIS